MKKRPARQPEHWGPPPIEVDRPRPVQYFSAEYLEQCKQMKPDDILRFLDEFRQLYSPARRRPSRSINLRVPEHLLEAFKTKARLHDVPYQTQIKRLMMDWLTGQSTEPKAAKRNTSRRRGGATNV